MREEICQCTATRRPETEPLSGQDHVVDTSYKDVGLLSMD